MPKILMLMLVLMSFCKAVDLQAVAEFKRDRLVEKLTNLYLKENSKTPKNELLSKAVNECFNTKIDDKITDKDLSSCNYAFIQIVEKKEKVDNLYTNNIVELGLSYATMSSIIDTTKKANEKEAYKLIAINTSNFVIDYVNFLLQDENTKNNKMVANSLNDYKKMAQGVINLTIMSACPLFVDDKPLDKKIDSPFICRLKIVDLYEKKEFKGVFLNNKFLCDEYKDKSSCLVAGLAYEMGQGVRFDLKQAKKYYGLACDNGEQVGCDEFKRLYYQ